jgi:hypothetical protein
MPDATVPALIPLSLLEAIRNLDTPLEDGLEEQLAEEIVARRLGLSSTVAAQIQRYRQTAERAGGVPLDEAISVIRLVGRRPDAGLAFADAGRRAARYAARSSGRPAWTMLRASPPGWSRRLALRAATRVARTTFDADLCTGTGGTEVRMSLPLSIQSLPDGIACTFYGSAYSELLRWLAGFEGTMIHERCQVRGDEVCLWRAVTAEVYE